MSNTKEANLIYSLIQPVVWATQPCIDYTDTLGGIIYGTEGGESPRKYLATQDFGVGWGGFFLVCVVFNKPSFEEVRSKPPDTPGNPLLPMSSGGPPSPPAPGAPQPGTLSKLSSVTNCFLNRNMLRKRESETTGFPGFVPPLFFSCSEHKEDARNP